MHVCLLSSLTLAFRGCPVCLSVVARPQLVRGRARTPRSGQASRVWLQGHSQAPDSEQACPGVRLGQTLASPAWSAALGVCPAPPRARGSAAARVRGASRAPRSLPCPCLCAGAAASPRGRQRRPGQRRLPPVTGRCDRCSPPTPPGASGAGTAGPGRSTTHFAFHRSRVRVCRGQTPLGQFLGCRRGYF